MCFSVSQGSVATRCVCGGKYDTNLVANLLMSLTMKKIENRSTWRVSSGTFYGPQCIMMMMTWINVMSLWCPPKSVAFFIRCFVLLLDSTRFFFIELLITCADGYSRSSAMAQVPDDCGRRGCDDNIKRVEHQSCSTGDISIRLFHNASNMLFSAPCHASPWASAGVQHADRCGQPCITLYRHQPLRYRHALICRWHTILRDHEWRLSITPVEYNSGNSGSCMSPDRCS